MVLGAGAHRSLGARRVRGSRPRGPSRSARRACLQCTFPPWRSTSRFDPPLPPMLAKPATHPRRRRLAVRAQVGRLSRARVQGRRRALHPEPRPEAARPLLPRARGHAARRAARALRARRRDRDRAPTAASTSTRCCCASTRRRRASQHARGGRTGVVRRVGPARARRRRPARAPARRAARARSSARSRDVRAAACTSRRPRATSRSRADWFERFEGAGLDGVIAKPDTLVYTPGKRVMVKIKHQRTADCVVAGFRWYKGGKGTLVGSLLLGLYDDAGMLHHVGVCARSSQSERAKLAELLAPLRDDAREQPPVARLGRVAGQRRGARAAPARRDEPVEPRQGSVVGAAAARAGRARSRTTTCRARGSATRRTSSAGARTSRRATCRYDQLDATAPVELARLFGG